MRESVFISYSSADEAFVKRLYQNLIDSGVNCWYAPINAQPGQPTHEQITQAIESHDRLLLVLSHTSMQSGWVQTELSLARAIEAREGRRKLFPIRLVPYEDITPWTLFDADLGVDSAKKVREYSIPDFSGWVNEDTFQEQLNKLLLALWRSAPERAAGESFLLNELPRILEAWNHSKTDAYIATLDVDYMTQINKVHGPAVGSAVLSTIARLLEQRGGVVRSGRFGDDTFFATTTIGVGRKHKPKAVRFADGLLRMISGYHWDNVKPQLRATCSIGLARLSEQDSNAAITAAVRGYIDAKRNGGNRVQYAGPSYITPSVPRPTDTARQNVVPEWRRLVS